MFQIWHIWIILCHHLVLFLQIKLNSLSLSQTHLLRHKESLFKDKLIQRFQKLPLFPIIKYSPHKRPTFDNKRQQRVFWQTKTLTLLFQNSQVVASYYQKLVSCGENGGLLEIGGVFDTMINFYWNNSLYVSTSVFDLEKIGRASCRERVSSPV